MKKMRMYEEMFLKKAQEEARKKILREKREIRKQLSSVGASATKDRKSNEIDVISEADQISKNGDSSGSVEPTKRRGRGGYRRGRGRGRRGRRGRGRGFSSRKQSSVPRRRVSKDDDKSASDSSSSEDEEEDDEDEDDDQKSGEDSESSEDVSMSHTQ